MRKDSEQSFLAGNMYSGGKQALLAPIRRQRVVISEPTGSGGAQSVAF